MSGRRVGTSVSDARDRTSERSRRTLRMDAHVLPAARHDRLATRAHTNQELRRFLYQNVYYHPRVAEVNRNACEMLRSVFEAYLHSPDLVGEGASKRIEAEGLHRTVCDYIAGMTDRYLMEEYARHVGEGGVME